MKKDTANKDTLNKEPLKKVSGPEKAISRPNSTTK